MRAYRNRYARILCLIHQKGRRGRKAGMTGRSERGRDGKSRKAPAATKKTAHKNMSAAKGKRFFFMSLFCVKSLSDIYKNKKV